MRDLIILSVHVIATLARLLGPGGIRSVVADSVLVKQQPLILNRSRQRAPNLWASDRVVAGLCALFMQPRGILHCRVVLPRTLFLIGATAGILTLVASRATFSAADFSGRVVAISDRDTVNVLHDGRAEKVLTAHLGGGRVGGGWMHTSSS